MEKILKVLGPTFLALKEFGFAYGIQGMLLRQNFEKLWFEHCVTKSKYNIFFIPSNTVTSNVKSLIEIGLYNTPFGIAYTEDVKNIWNNSFSFSTTKSIQHKIAKVITVYESDDAIGSVKDLFYKKQRERKSWWRTISENPSIYHIQEGEYIKGQEFIEIKAQFSFGNIVVEKIYFRKNASVLLPGISKNSNLRIVEHITSLDWACLALLCDGYIEIEGSKELQIHPKLSPFKAYCIANISPEDDDVIKEDLNDLTLYIIELLRERGVESIIINNVKMPNIIKVPYIVNVNSESLKSGLVKLVCQRTLCGETVHITDVSQRMYDLCV